MKTIKLSYIGIALILSGTAWSADNHVPHTQIICSVEGDTTKVIFKGPEGIDLRFPQRFPRIESVLTVPITINGTAKPVDFKVDISQTRTGESIRYKYRNPFFISDIQIIFNKGYFGYHSTVYGSWTHDYPPASQLNCEFAP